MLKVIWTASMEKSYFSVEKWSKVYILEDENSKQYVWNDDKSYFYDDVSEFMKQWFIKFIFII